ncbi:MAG: hypothetical protein MJB14_07555 [Spirochaetes bacterium]|nr:hypothetical protein [Spirochaetota bacterium]
MSDLTSETKTNQFPCPNCAGNMQFDPKTQKLVCPYCQHALDIANDQQTIKEYDMKTAEEKANYNWGEQKRVIKCEGCGAETILAPTKTADFCAFCGSSHIINQNESDSKTIVPETLIPFQITKKNAQSAFQTWIKKRFFAPNALKKSYQSSSINGVYIPCWTYDSDTHSAYTAEAGTYYYETETVTEKDEDGNTREVTKEVRKTRWRSISGFYHHFFDDVLVNASKNVDEKLIKRLEPFQLESLTAYQPQFLSGFQAERYSVHLKKGWDKAKEIMKSAIYNGIHNSIHADEVRNIHFTTNYQDVKFKHILLPIWISSYKYKNKLYNFLVNGQTGKVSGYSPISIFKILTAILTSAAVIGLISYLIYYFSHQG